MRRLRNVWYTRSYILLNVFVTENFHHKDHRVKQEPVVICYFKIVNAHSPVKLDK